MQSSGKGHWRTLWQARCYVSECQGKYTKQIDKVWLEHAVEGHKLTQNAAKRKVDESSFVADLYFEGVSVRKILDISYTDFEQNVKNPIKWPSYRYGWIKCPYRNGNKYRKNEDHKPKEPSPKEAWRIQSGATKDKSKAGRYWIRSRKFWVKQNAKDHRAWANNMIKKENWEAFSQWDEEYTINPWDWD